MAATTQVRLLVWSLTNLPRTDFCFPLAPIARSERDATKRTARANNRYSAKRCSPKPSRLGRNSHANPRTLPNGKPKDATAIAGNEATIATAQALREKLGCLASSRYAISQMWNSSNRRQREATTKHRIGRRKQRAPQISRRVPKPPPASRKVKRR